MKEKSLRKAYGESLVALGSLNKNIVVLEADLGKSTMSYLFKNKFPDRYFEMGIAEQNMASASAGLALAGKIPFYNTFAVFASGRAYDQIRCSIAIAEANVKIVGSSCGLSDFGDGKTHQSIEDSNLLKVLPNIVVLNPCDSLETVKMVETMVDYHGPVYLRINRNEFPIVTNYSEDEKFTIGKISKIRTGSDVVIFTTGSLVHQSLIAAENLEKLGISVEIANVSTLKPLFKDEIMKFVEGKKAIVTAEEANIVGGLGSSIAGLIIGEIHIPFEQIGINDEFGRSAHSYEDLLKYYNLTSANIENAVKRSLNN